jgi:hypothetical protein
MALAVVAVIVLAGAAYGVVKTGTFKSKPPVVAVQSYSAPGANFQAAFPARAMVSHATMSLVGIDYEATAYTAFTGQQTFSATVYPFPLGKPTISAEQFLRNLTGQVAASQGLTIPGSTPTVYRGLPALTALLVAPGGKQFIKVLALLDGHIGYVLMVSGSSATPAGYASFVDSFKLLAS